jgi:hypothetical protein
VQEAQKFTIVCFDLSRSLQTLLKNELYIFIFNVKVDFYVEEKKSTNRHE